MLKYENIFAKGYIPYLSEEVFMIKKVKITVTWTYLISDLNDNVKRLRKTIAKSKSEKVKN